MLQMVSDNLCCSGELFDIIFSVIDKFPCFSVVMKLYLIISETINNGGNLTQRDL